MAEERIDPIDGNGDGGSGDGSGDDAGTGSGRGTGGRGTGTRARRSRAETGAGPQSPFADILEVSQAGPPPPEPGKRAKKGSKVGEVSGKALAASFMAVFQALAAQSLGPTAYFTREEKELIEPNLALLISNLPVSVNRQLSQWVPAISLLTGFIMWGSRQMEAKRRAEVGEPAAQPGPWEGPQSYAAYDGVPPATNGVEAVYNAPPPPGVAEAFGDIA